MDDFIKKNNIYELLEVQTSATVVEIKKAYRKKALKCHPDKNPDNPKAVESFRQLTKALEVLCDEVARTAYDRILRARQEAKERTRLLDSKRRKLKEELEAKEKAAREEKDNKSKDEEKLAREIERLRKEGSHIVEEEHEYLKQQILEQKLKNSDKLPRLKCKWNRKCSFDEDYLRNKFKTCGKISCLVVSRKGNSAIVEFEKTEAAVKAFNLNSESLQIEWVQGNPKDASSNDEQFENFSNNLINKSKVYFDELFEQKVLKRLHEAHLIQQKIN